MIRLVLSDMDGTLIPFGKKSPSPRTMRAITQLEDAGVRFGLATGRDVGELMQFFGSDDRAYRTGILSNGKKIMVDGELVRYTLIDPGALTRLSDFVQTFEGCFVTAVPLETDGSEIYYCITSSTQEAQESAETFKFKYVMSETIPDLPIVAATIACKQDQDTLDYIKSEGARLCPELDFLQPAPHWCDILPRGLNKGTALSMLLDELGVTSDEVVVLGDAENDLALFGAVEHSVAVANATPAAKAAAHWHIGRAEDDAVAVALEDIAEAAKSDGVPAFMKREDKDASVCA